MDRAPGMGDGDVDGKVIVWHVFQGVMVVPWWKYGENRFFACWTPPSAYTRAWIGTGDRPPRKEDADPMNCVMALTREEETVVTGYHQMRDRQRFTHWRPLPCPPEDAEVLREQKSVRSYSQ